MEKATRKVILKIGQICLDMIAFGILMGYMCDTPPLFNGCYSFGPRKTYESVAAFMALSFSSFFLITAILKEKVKCPCNLRQLEKVSVYTVSMFMLVAACLESTLIDKGFPYASSNYAAACFFWFAFSAYVAELILDFDLIGELGFGSSESSEAAHRAPAPSVPSAPNV